MKDIVAAWVAHYDEIDENMNAACALVRLEGLRVVDGGSIGYGEWAITDYATGEILASGSADDDFDAAWESNWVHHDRIFSDVVDATEEPDDPEGWPSSLAEAVAEWVGSNRDDARLMVAADTESETAA